MPGTEEPVLLYQTSSRRSTLCWAAREMKRLPCHLRNRLAEGHVRVGGEDTFGEIVAGGDRGVAAFVTRTWCPARVWSR